jgi:hypothetical protein
VLYCTAKRSLEEHNEKIEDRTRERLRERCIELLRILQGYTNTPLEAAFESKRESMPAKQQATQNPPTFGRYTEIPPLSELVHDFEEFPMTQSQATGSIIDTRRHLFGPKLRQKFVVS